MKSFNTDNPSDVKKLLEMHPHRVEYKRFSRYGGTRAARLGLLPVEDQIALVDPKDYKEVVAHCHKEQIFPMYAQKKTWAPGGFRYNQNGLGYCWTWGGTGALMTTRAVEDKDTVPLAPVSMGYLVGWANRGNYLESWINGAKQKGVCTAFNGDINDHRNSASVWSPKESERALYRLDMVWDCNPGAGAEVMVQHALTILASGRPLFIAYNWWGHALHCVGYEWSEGSYLNLKPIIRNSHDEDDFITLEGSKSIFDESYGFISSVAT